MSKVEKIEHAIEELSHDDREKLAAWLNRRRAEIEAEEDRIDLEAARRSLAEPGENIPWKTVKRENGLA